LWRRSCVSQGAISIKGIRQGVLVRLEEWDAGLLALEAQLKASPAFFRDGRVALDVGARELGHSRIEDVQALLARRQVELWAVVSTSPATQAVAREMGFETDLVLSKSSPPRKPSVIDRQPEQPAGEDLVVRRTLRSGQRLHHPNDIVVIGDVNPGAEVIAGGDIVVWGRVRGILHAGASGDEAAVICALDLSPMQLRIAGHIALSPEERRSRPMPEMASVRDGQIIAVPWQRKDPGRAR
jgi:septum site-determining protein MinC